MKLKFKNEIKLNNFKIDVKFFNKNNSYTFKNEKNFELYDGQIKENNEEYFHFNLDSKDIFKLNLFYNYLKESEFIIFIKESDNINNSMINGNSNNFSSIIYFKNLIDSNENFNENKSINKMVNGKWFRDHNIIGNLETNIFIEYNNLFIQNRLGIRNEENIGLSLKFQSINKNKKFQFKKNIDIEYLENLLEELTSNFYEENDFYEKFKKFLKLLKIKWIKYEEEIFIIQNLYLKIISKIIKIINDKFQFENNKLLKIIILLLKRKELSLKMLGYDSKYKEINSKKSNKSINYIGKNIKLKYNVSNNFIKIINKLIIFIKDKLNVI